MNKVNLSLIATVVPLVIVAIGLIGWVLSLRSDVTVAIKQQVVLEEQAESLENRMNTLETRISVASDQMKTIMGDHEVMGELLSDLGKSQPTGERREYGGY
jgi:hypothetical protein|tara:strand:- start:151 stop:453 length:303 start_codon:yes stop_codon:yes gene_type:complete